MISSRKPRSSERTQQTKNDYKHGDKWLAVVGPHAYNKMEKFLKKYMGKCFLVKNIVDIAMKTAGCLNINCDRIARRKKEFLFCWLILNWNAIEPTFIQKMNDVLQEKGYPPQLNIEKIEFSSEFYETSSEKVQQAPVKNDPPKQAENGHEGFDDIFDPLNPIDLFSSFDDNPFNDPFFEDQQNF